MSDVVYLDEEDLLPDMGIEETSSKTFRAQTDLAYFSEYCFRHPFKNTWFHQRWYETMQDTRVEKGLIIAPRSSAKSTCWGKIGPLWILGNNVDTRILLVSRTATLAKRDMRFIRTHIENNNRVHEVFPDLKPSSPWGEDAITVVNNRNDGDASVNAVGLGGSVTGLRADLIVCDDLIDKNNVMTEGQREKVNDFWNETVMGTLEPDGRIFLVGTRFHNKDFYSRMFDDKEYKDNTFMFPALELDEKGEYKLNEKGEMISYWPERWPVSRLLKRREDMGSLAFASQYMCDPSGYEGRIFDPEHLQYYDPEKELLPIWGRLEFVMAVDPNITEDPSSDNTAIITGALDRRYSTLYIIDMYAKPLDFIGQLKVMKQYGRRIQVKAVNLLQPEMRISKIGVEAVAYQRALQQTTYFQGLPVVQIQHQKTDKNVRILRIQPHIENGRVKFPKSAEDVQPHWWDGFYEEYCTFPRGRRDDRLDALETLISMVSSSFGESGIPWGPTDVRMRRRDGWQDVPGWLQR